MYGCPLLISSMWPKIRDIRVVSTLKVVVINGICINQGALGYTCLLNPASSICIVLVKVYAPPTQPNWILRYKLPILLS